MCHVKLFSNNETTPTLGCQFISFLIEIELCKWSLMLKLVLHLSSLKTIVKKCMIIKTQVKNLK